MDIDTFRERLVELCLRSGLTGLPRNPESRLCPTKERGFDFGSRCPLYREGSRMSYCDHGLRAPEDRFNWIN